jgi:peptidyl-prolyl cis-trans isomerase C
MTRHPCLLRAALLTFALPVLAAAVQEGDTRVVADVAGRPILASDLRDRLAAERKQAAAENRLEAFGSKAVAMALDQLLDVKLFAAQARTEGLADRADVKHAIENAVDAVLAQTLVGERAQKVPTDEAVLRRYYDEHPHDYEAPGRVHARHIVVKTEAEAAALLGKLKRNADFVQLARANNVDATREKGGDLGFVKRGVMVEAFDRALFSLKAGETSPVIRTPYGYHIVRVEEIELPTRAPFTTVVADVRQRVLQAQVQAWKAEIAKAHPVKVNEQVLKTIQ